MRVRITTTTLVALGLLATLLLGSLAVAPTGALAGSGGDGPLDPPVHHPLPPRRTPPPLTPAPAAATLAPATVFTTITATAPLNTPAVSPTSVTATPQPFPLSSATPTGTAPLLTPTAPISAAAATASDTTVGGTAATVGATATSSGTVTASPDLSPTTSATPAELPTAPAGELPTPDPARAVAVQARYGALPLSFEQNEGQTDGSVRFLSRGAGYTLFLTGSAAVLALLQAHTPALSAREPAGRDGRGSSAVTQTVPLSESVVRLQFAGANPTPQIVGADQLPGSVNYFIGNDPHHWQTNIPTYARVTYHDVYPGIDLVYYGTQGHLEYDWIVQPGADPHTIHLAIDGAQGMQLDAQGNLVLQTAAGDVRQDVPAVYQEVDGQRTLVSARYVVTDAHQVGVAVGAYDRSKPLIIDPVLVYSTYLGGNNDDAGSGVAVDSTGSAYITGATSSLDFPTAYPAQGTTQGGYDVFVAKLTATGTALVYSTYIGGGGDDDATGIAVDSAGNAYITGYTNSGWGTFTDFPTTVNALQRQNHGNDDAFVTKLNAAGNTLLYSTYLGGGDGDYAYGIAVDSAGSAYITGLTFSSDFPVANALQSHLGGTCSQFCADAFVAKLDPDGSTLVYSTYLGGSGYDTGTGIAADAAGNAYVTGNAGSSDFPTTEAPFGPAGSGAFVTKVNATGTALVYSTYLSAAGGNSIAVDSAGNAYVTGSASGPDFPTTNALQSTYGGGDSFAADAFVTKVNAAGSALLYSTYLGGSGGDVGYGIAVDSADNAYVTGATDSSNFPVAKALYTYGGGTCFSFAGDVPCSDGFVTKLTANGSLDYSTYLGGSNSDTSVGIAVDAEGAAYVTGQTASSNFPTTSALQGQDNGSDDAFVAKISPLGSGITPWHPHENVRLSAGLRASVDLSDGHVDVTTDDMQVPGRGRDLVLTHTWDSALAQAGISSTLGVGWQSSLTPSMGGLLTGTVTYADASGALWPFGYLGDISASGPYTAYSSPPGLPWQLTASTAGYTLTNVLTGESLTFDGQGRLVADTDSYGNSNTLSYGDSGPLTETNSGGRALTVAYQGGLLSEVQSPLWQSSGGTLGQHLSYGYSGGQLTTLTQGAGTPGALTTTFGYSGTQLVTLTTPGGHVWTIGYDPFGRVSTLTSPADPTTGTPSYTTAVTYLPGQTQVVEGYGSRAPVTTTYTLDAQGEATGITNALGHTSSATYDADHDLTSSTDALGHTTTYTYTYVGPSTGAGIASTGLLTETDQPAPNLPPNAAPVVTGYHYNATNDLDEVDRPNGGTVRYTYDGHHSVASTAEQLSATAWRGTLNTYDPFGELLATTDGRGVSVSADERTVTPNSTADAYTRRSTYTPQGDLQSASTPPITTTLGANTPVTTTYGYDLDGNLSTMTTPNGNTTTYSYDALGRLVQTTQPSVTLWDDRTAAPTESLGYDGDGNVISSTDGAGDLTQYSYDPLGRLVSTVNPVGATTLYTYSATTLTAVQDPAGHVTTYGYDAAGERISTTDPLGTQTQTGYDAVGNTTAITTPLSYAYPQTATVESVGYDALDSAVTDTSGGVGDPSFGPPQTTLSAYTADGTLSTRTLAAGDVASYTYDRADRLTQATLATTGSPTAHEAFTLDPADNLTTQVDFNERTHQATFDGDNRLTQQIDTCPTCYDNLPIATDSSYDANGNLRGLVQQEGALLAAYSATYNAAGWLLSQNDNPLVASGGQLVQGNAVDPSAYGYDAGGRLITQSIFNGAGAITAQPDPAGRILAISDTAPGTTTVSTSRFTYTSDSQPLTDTLPAGLVTDRRYDPDGRLASIATQNASFQYLTQYAFTPQNKLAAITTTTDSGVPEPEYLYHDPFGRLSASIGSDGTQATYRYDGDGNLIQINQGHPLSSGEAPPLYALYQYGYTTSATPTNWLPNELVALTVHSNTTSYGYDNNGDTTDLTNTTTAGGAYGINDTLYYDGAGRLVGAVRADSNDTDSSTAALGIAIGYNARGLRDSYTVLSAGSGNPPPPRFQERISYRGDQVGQVVVTGTTTTPFTDTFVYRPDGTPLELLYQSQDGEGNNKPLARYWYVVDGQGSVFALVNAQGTPVDTYVYDAWGAPDVAATQDAVPQPLRYRGYWYDGWDNSLSSTQDQGWDTGPLPWYWLGTRAYDPVLKRFLQPDPSSREGVRSYAYVQNDPVDNADPDGLMSSAEGPGDNGGVGPAWEPPMEGPPPPPVMPGESVAPASPSGEYAETAAWSPQAPNGPKPPVGAPGAAEYRYQRYLYRQFQAGVAQEDVLGPVEWKSRYYDPVEAGGRPGRSGGPDQVATRNTLTSEGYINTESIQLGERPGGPANMVDMYRPNSLGGTDYVEVDNMLQDGRPVARMRTKLTSELEALGPNDRLIYVDKANPLRRIMYYPGDGPSAINERTGP